MVKVRWRTQMPMTTDDELCLVIVIIVNLARLLAPLALGRNWWSWVMTFHFPRSKTGFLSEELFGSLFVDVCRHRDSCCS